MKKILIALSLLFSTFSCVASKVTIPKEIRGFWSFKVDHVGEWNGIMIGNNYVEHYYKICSVDSLSKVGGLYKIWLTDEAGLRLTLELTKIGTDNANLKFGHWSSAKECIKNLHDPDLSIFDHQNIPEFLKNEWVSNTDIHDQFMLKNPNILYQYGKKWKILLGGTYLAKEYRFILKNNNTYRIAYLYKGENSFTVSDRYGKTTYIPKAKFPIVYEFLGNWIDAISNKWKYGFFENFAILNEKVYQYELINKKGGYINISLRNGSENKRLKFKLLNDSTTAFLEAGKIVNTYLFKSALKPDRQTDTTLFRDTHFAGLDTAVISGYLRNAPNNQPFSVMVSNALTGKEERFYADLDSNGFFRLNLPLLNTSFAVLDWGRAGSGRIDAIEPGEHIFYFEDFRKKKALVMGKNAIFHNQIINFNLIHPLIVTNQIWHLKDTSNYQKFLEICKNINEQALGYLGTYLLTNPNASRKFKYFVSEYYRFDLGKELLSRRFQVIGESGFPKPYFRYISDTLYKNTPPVPSTLVREFNFFKNEYYNYIRSKESQISVSFDEVLKELLSNNLIPATIAEKAAITEQIQLKEVTEGSKNTANAKQSPPLDQKTLKLANAFREKYQDKINIAASEKISRLSNEKYKAFLNTLPNEDFRNLFYVQKIFDYYAINNSAMPQNEFTYSVNQIKNQFYQSEITKKQNFYLNLNKVDIDYSESLKRTEHLKSANNADSIFRELTSHYKGNVIYIDFWGTWCAPCLKEMKYVKSVRDSLVGKKVIFMYFANNSSEISWKNMIKQFGLTSDNTVHYRLPERQQAILENRLSITSFPTYMIIDKEGNVNTMKAPRPSEGKEMVAYINKLLDR